MHVCDVKNMCVGVNVCACVHVSTTVYTYMYVRARVCLAGIRQYPPVFPRAAAAGGGVNK